VAIGRNEGERLRRCLASVLGVVERVVYVDSGSTDGSVAMAISMGADVVELDMSTPFTAARARNEGFSRLQSLCPNLSYVQFVDGDCEVAANWLVTSSAFLVAHPEVAVVCGRRRERFPERSVYNLLCDVEWNSPIGEAKACGGDALMRAEVLCTAGGYRAGLIAGEEPELCLRLRAAGWKIWRLDAEMTLHDAAMLRFGQWWKRLVRGGHAYAEGAYLHGASVERHWVHETRRIWFWALGLPVLSLASLAAFDWVWLAVLLVYPLQVVRLAFRGQSDVRTNWLRALFLVLAKFPELQGQLTFWWRKVSAGKTTLIEYK
jgi:glycosyltransferase involved in cell wall biosynthesis